MTIDIDEAKVNRFEVRLWLAWTLATIAGMLLGFVPFTFLVADLEAGLVRVLIPLWAGLLIGLLQWLALRPYLTRSEDWVLTHGAGWALGFALGLFVIEAMGKSPLGALLGYLLFGLIIGALQWPVLRREVPNALAWIITSMIGWALGAYLSQVVLNVVAAGSEVSQIVSTTVVAGITGLVAGAITGLALVWIVRQPERAAIRRSGPAIGEPGPTGKPAK